MRLKNLKILIVIIWFAAFSAALSQINVESYTIAGISVEGNNFADSETILALSGLRAGDKINYPADDKLQSAIKNIWKRKQFEDVQIIVDKVSPAGLYLLIKVKEFPRLYKILVKDNEEIESKDIALAVGKIKGDIFTPYDAYLAKKSVKKLYSKEGLAFAKVKTEIVSADTGIYVNLNISVEEGVEFYVDKIIFNGNSILSDKDLAGAFDETHTKSWWQFWRSSKFNLEDYKKDVDLLKKYFKKKGFMDAEIVKDTLMYDEENEKVIVRIDLYEGQKYFVRNISFAGNTIYQDKDLLKRLSFESGDVYDHDKFQSNLNGNQDQTDALSLYMDNGYLQSRMEPKEIRVASDSVDIEISVFENERYTIGKVEIIGNKKTKDKVIRRELYTRPGDYFDRSSIIRSIRALGVMNYFNPEALKPDVLPSSSDKTSVDVVYNVEERSTDTFNASVGFAGSFGLTGSIGMTFNNFSILEPLKGGGGQVFNFNYEFGQAARYRNFSLGISEPWLFDEPTTVGFNVFDQYYNYVINQRRTGVGVNFGRRFRWPDDYFRGDWSVRVQSNDIIEGGDIYREGKYTELTLGQKISRISLNNLFFPSTGSRFSFETSYAMGSIGIGSTDYLKNELNFEILNPIMQVKGQDRMVLFLSSKLGYITGINTDTTISPIELYYMGGNGLSGFAVTPMRGYEDRSIGSKKGGKLISKYTAELRFALSLDPMPIYVYAFAEAGNVWDNLKTADPFDLKRSAGLGIQMFINPIGILGFSYGYGFDNPIGSAKVSGWRFLFHLGQ